MFVNLMRSNQRWLMIIVSALVIISFVFFYSNRTQMDRGVSNQAGKIYGHSLTTDDLARVERQLQTAEDLRLYELVSLVTGNGMDGSDALVNHLVLQHEAQAYGIEPTADEIKDAEMKLPVFQGPNGEFDPTKYATFVDEKLTPRGFSDTQLDDLVRRNLQFAKLREIVDAGVVVSPADVRLAYEERFSKTDASVIRLKTADFTRGRCRTDGRRDQEVLRRAEGPFPAARAAQGAVREIRLGRCAEEAHGHGRKMDALKPNADHALEFLEQLEEQKGKADFSAVAANAKLPVQETPEFEENQTTGFPEASITGFVEAAFKLVPQDPNSDVPLQAPSAQLPDAYYDLHLAGVTPTRQLTLDEAKPKIVTAIKDERARAALTAKAEEIRTKLADALKGGLVLRRRGESRGPNPAGRGGIFARRTAPRPAGCRPDRGGRHRVEQWRTQQVRADDRGRVVGLRARAAAGGRETVQPAKRPHYRRAAAAEGGYLFLANGCARAVRRPTCNSTAASAHGVSLLNKSAR